MKTLCANQLFQLLSLLLISITINSYAGNRPQYVFPPLENRTNLNVDPAYTYNSNSYQAPASQTMAPQTMDPQTMAPQTSYQPQQNSYFRQPRYIFPELETAVDNKGKYKYQPNNRSYKMPYDEEHQSYQSYQSKGDNTFSRSEQEFCNQQSNQPYQSRYDSGSNYWPNTYSTAPGRYNNYDTSPWNNNVWNNNKNFNGFPSPMGNSLQGFGNNNWSPFSGNQSIWPGSTNRSYDSDSIYNPGIRVPGFFSR